MLIHKRLISFVLIAVLLAAAFPLVSMPAPASAADAWTVMDSGTTENLYSVWGSSCSDVFAVGYNGTILHYDGTAWTAMNSGITSLGLTGVWGSSSNNVFAVGWSGTILHYDGSTWSPMTSNTLRDLNAVWGNSANSVFAVGSMQTIMYWNGSTWTAMTTPGLESSFNAIWGTAYNNVYTVGNDGDIYHFDGTSWTLQTSDTSATLFAIWGSSASDIWAAGSLTTSKVHYNGSAWSGPGGYPLYEYYTGLWGTSSSNIYMTGHTWLGNNGTMHYYNGSGWSSLVIPSCSSLNGIWGNNDTNIFAVGDSGGILYYGSGCVAGPSRATVGTTLGEIAFTTDAGLIGRLLNVKIASTKCATPAGFDFPYGLFSFNITGLTNGQTVRVTIKFPRRLPNNVKYYKCIDNRMVDCTSLITRLDDYTLVLSLTDGKLGDSDNSANGTIVDPGGPVESVAASQVYGQGTMPVATQQAPVSLPSVSIKSASLSSTKVGPGEPVTVTANVANTGTINGASSIKVYVNGELENTQGVTVSSGSTTPLTFTVCRNEPGIYEVYVGGARAGSFTVDQFTPQTILIISAALVFLAFILGVIYMTRRKQAH